MGKYVKVWKEARVFAFKEKQKLSRKLSEKWRVGDDAVSRKLLSIRRRVENEANEKGKCGTVGRKRMQKQ